MFGTITVNQEELKGKEWKRYRAYYCGVCRALKQLAGRKGQLTLTYDLTFLALLLDSLYECAHTEQNVRCLLHPTEPRPFLQSDAILYAAKMNLLLSYDNLRDDWRDDRNVAAAAAAAVLKRARNRVAAEYPRQAQAVEQYLCRLHRMEEEQEPNPDAAAGATGDMLAEIFQWRQDEWSEELRTMGFYLGKFIYLTDAAVDLPKDQSRGGYNPFSKYQGEQPIQEYEKQVLTMMAARAAAAFERLPVIENAEILRNILYAGIWNKFEHRKVASEKDAGKRKA